MTFNAFVLAAGYGKRLRPITDLVPKPLAPLANRPLLDSILEDLAQAGAERIGVNGHHLASLIEAFVRGHRLAGQIDFFPEAEILGTGGALANAKKFLASADVCVLRNGDVVCDLDLPAVLDHHHCSGNLVTMVLADASVNNVLASVSGEVLDIADLLAAPAPEGARRLTFTGISVISKAFVQFLPDHPQFATLIQYYLDLKRTCPGKLGAYIPGQFAWDDLGTVANYLDHNRALAKRLGPLVLSPEAKLSPNAKLSGFVFAAANSVVADGATVRNCVLLPGAKLEAGGFYSDEAVGPGFSAHRDQASLAKLPVLSRGPWAGGRVSTLAARGSSRKFYRVSSAAGRHALMLAPNDHDWDNYLKIGAYLGARGLGTPSLLDVDSENGSMLMEDLGDDTLWDVADRAKSPEALAAPYRQTVDFLAKFQALGTRDLDQCPEANRRALDHEQFRWETNYCRDNFLVNVAGLRPEDTAHLDQDFETLARMTDALPKTIIHRDFQSQNILLFNSEVRIVDFQGARRGPLFYDIASLLNDGYFVLPAPLKAELLERYRTQLAETGVARLSKDEARTAYILCATQRVSQILGAYGFLSLQKGKMEYLDYCATALGYLRAVLEMGVENAATRPMLAPYLKLVAAIDPGALERRVATLRG